MKQYVSNQLQLLDVEVTKKEVDVLGDWAVHLKGLLGHPNTLLIKQRLSQDLKNQLVLYPSKDKWFRAIKECSFDSLKVVILGQDPYYNGSANGLAFGSDNPNKCPASLRVILKAANSIDSVSAPHDFSLRRWANSGILLLNTCLTVIEGQSKSHNNIGWQWFTKEIIKASNKKNPIYLLWGSEANKFKTVIDNKDNIISCEHPASSLYNETDWNFNDCFNKTNQLLTKQNKPPIIW